MFTWKLLTDDEAKSTWDKNLERMDDCSPFQSYAVGQWHGRLGWAPRYWAATDEREATVAMCLGLLRRYPLGLGIIWCPGGPVGNIQSWDEGFREVVLKTSRLKHAYLRFRCDRERTISDALLLDHKGWARSISPMTSSFSMELDLTLDENELLSQLHTRWRRNLRLAGQSDLKIKLCGDPDIDELIDVLRQMEKRKQLSNLFTREKLVSLFEHADKNLVFFRCEDRSGNLIAFRGALTAGSRASDYIAAATDKGRELRASYSLLWSLALKCRELGVTKYDLGGIDPWTNPGVYAFKKNTRAREVESLGEWDWATSPTLRLLGNWAIGRRKAVRSARHSQDEGKTSKPIPQLVLSGPQTHETSAT